MSPADDPPKSPVTRLRGAADPEPADKGETTPDTERQDMTTRTKVSPPAHRFVLPAACSLLALSAALWGEYVLVEHAGQPTMGPLLAHQISVMVAVGFVALALVTLLLALFPGAEAPDDAEATNETAEPREDPEAIAAERRATDGVIAALKKTATKATTGRLAAESRAEQAEARVGELEEALTAFREGTSPEAKALRAAIREEIHREAMSKVRELGEASERLTAALKEGKARVEADLKDRESELDALRERLPAIRQEAAEDERRRIQIALTAVNETQPAGLDPLQVRAVDAHVARLAEVLDRLAIDPDESFDPGVAMPPLTSSNPALLADDEPQEKPKRGLLRRRR